VIQGTRDILPKHALGVRPGMVRVHALPPILTEGRGTGARDAVMLEIRSAMERALLESGKIGSTSRVR